MENSLIVVRELAGEHSRTDFHVNAHSEHPLSYLACFDDLDDLAFLFCFLARKPNLVSCRVKFSFLLKAVVVDDAARIDCA
jgi:hypothetical protein